MGRKGNLAVFESSNISQTGEITPTKIGVHVCYINPYLHDFFEPIRTGEVTPTKIGVHVCYINLYLHDFFEPILSN